VEVRIRDSSNPDSILLANFAGDREDSNPKELIPVFPKAKKENEERKKKKSKFDITLSKK
jgi:hypothetical protein